MSQKDWPGSVLSKTPVTPAGPYLDSAASGIWSMNDVAYWVKQANWPTPNLQGADPYFYDVSLLLTGNGTNGAQNNTFLDSSTAAQTMTRVNNPTQGTFSPYGSLWSNSFNGVEGGTGDWLRFSQSGAFNFGTGDFTVEFWVNLPSNATTYWQVLNKGNSEIFNFYVTPGTTKMSFYAGAFVLNGTISLPIGQWGHVAYVRRSGTLSLYINGVLDNSVSWTTNVTDDYGHIGCSVSEAGYFLKGYVSNLRLNNTAVYTAAFTPSTTPLTAISGTTLLTCQSNRFKDSSSNNATFTYSGTPSVQRFSPFNPTAAYDPATISGSGRFDGGGDAVGTTGSISLGTGDFTAEAWWYPVVGPLQEACFIAVGDASQSSGFCLVTDNSRGLFVYSAGYVTAGYGFTPKLNAWNHVAVTRSGGTLRTYLNGSVCESASYGNNVSGAAYVGRTANGYFTNTNGYIAGARVLNTALYTGSTYTIPTTPFTNNANTQFLCNFTNAGIPDAAMMNDLETVGNAQVSTSVKKYGTGSLYFDGSGDYLQIQAPPLFLRTWWQGSFTIEYWIYANAFASGGNSDPIIVGNMSPTTSNNYWSFGPVSGGTVKFYYYNGSIQSFSTTTTLSTGQWYHLAFVNNAGSLSIYINGVSSATSSISGTPQSGSDFPFTIGSTNNTSFNGYIDDLRITKGYARYTANFTPPTAAFPTF